MITTEDFTPEEQKDVTERLSAAEKDIRALKSRVKHAPPTLVSYLLVGLVLLALVPVLVVIWACMMLLHLVVFLWDVMGWCWDSLRVMWRLLK